MEWNQYLKKILDKEHCLDDIKVSLNGSYSELPRIVKASVLLLEKMQKNQGNKNIFVFPDGEQIPFLFMVTDLIYSITSGKGDTRYSLDHFKEGQKVKIGNCIAEFIKVGRYEVTPDRDSIFLRFSDTLQYICPIELAPYLQATDTKRKISSLKKYREEKKKIDEEINKSNNSLQELKSLITHIEESTFYVGYVSNSEKQSNETIINDNTLFDYFFVSKTDYSGQLHNYAGKYMGTPAIIFASQVPYVIEAIANGANTREVIINLTECELETQLDSIDELIQKKIPVLCITDTADSFELKELQNRGFNIWRWDEESITSELIEDSSINAVKKLDKCVRAKVVYHSLKAPFISDGFSKLYKYNRVMENESAQLNEIYTSLLNMAYGTVRNICSIEQAEKERQLQILDNCSNALGIEKDFITNEFYKDFESIIGDFYKVYESDRELPKREELYALLLEKRWSTFYLICSNSDDLSFVQTYWKNLLAKSAYLPTIKAVYAKDFLSIEMSPTDVGIVAGWINSRILRKIIYGYKVGELHIFTYECEEKWKKAHVRSWNAGLKNNDNKVIIQKSFSKSIADISVDRHEDISNDYASEENTVLTQQDDFDMIVQESKYRQYVSSGGQGNEVVAAKPVGFVGGDFALYTENHKVLVVTNIVYQKANKIEQKEVNDLAIGDFIVVREASKDIIREIADTILKYEGKTEYRNKVSIWQEALKIEESFSSVDSVCRRLADAGCKRNYGTMRNWILSDDIIIPIDKDDLRIIAKVTDDEVLIEELDSIYEMGMYVRNTHIRAGRILSDRLAGSIGAKLLAGEKIDPYNIWDPIELEIKDVGAVKIYKIIDIASNWMSVNGSDTNKVLSEEKGSLLWQE